MKKYFLSAAIIPFVLCSCNNTSTNNKNTVIKGQEVTTQNAGGLTGATIKNNIELEAQNVKISQAYLMTEDRNIKPDNNANVNEKVIMTLETDTGWVKIDNKSFIGVSERVTDSKGNIVLDADDLFKNYETDGLPADIAKILNVSAVITKKNSDGNNDFDVSFKIWDRKGPGVVKGKYKLHIN